MTILKAAVKTNRESYTLKYYIDEYTEVGGIETDFINSKPATEIKLKYDR